MRSIKEFIRKPEEILPPLFRRVGGFLPDKIYIRWLYRLSTGRKLDLKNPKTFTEKIQWLKLNRRDPEMTVMVDKYAVKQFVSDRIGSKYIIPTLGVWNSADEIDWETLPKKFVLKATHGGGGTAVVVVRDKSEVDRNAIVAEFRQTLKKSPYKGYREWPYKNVPPRIIAEQIIELPDKFDLTDYKIFCFNGEPKYIQVIQDRHIKETIDFFDTEWNHQPFVGLNPKVENATTPVARPINLEEMLDVARKLSKGLDFVRVDMYIVENCVLFGELTFFPASGMGRFKPDEWNEKLGKLLILRNNKS